MSIFREKYITTRSGLTIYTESIGDPSDPAIILIMGALNQGIFWYDFFCDKLVEKSFFVIRFDHRDTGFSSVINFKESPYDLNDMTKDVVDIQNAYNIGTANFVGLSMGGYICQLLGVNHPEKVASLTLISTTPDHRPYMDATTGNFNNKYDLSYPEKSFLDYIEKGKNINQQSEKEVRDYQIEGWGAIINNVSNLDLQEISTLVDLSNKRSKDRYSAFNHGLAVFNSPERTKLLTKINSPTFIIHGEKDPCLPLDHGKLLHKLIKNSKFEVIENMGHMFTLTQSFLLAESITNNLKRILSIKF